MKGIVANTMAETQASEVIIWEADPETLQFTYVSQSAERLLGYTLEDWLTRGTFWIDLLHPADREHAVATCAAAVRECRDHDFEYRVISAAGRVVWIRDVVRVVCDDRGVIGLRGVMLDITDRRRFDEEFRHAQRTEVLGRLTSSIAHDFNNVLSTIVGFADIASLSPLSTGIRQELDEIKRAGELGMCLTQRLLAFSRTGALAPVIVDVNETLGAMASMLRRLVGDEIAVEVRLFARVATVRLGQGMLEQIVMNLATNARDAMPEGGMVRITTTNGVMPHGGLDDQQPAIVLEVTDTGSGMAPEILARIFDPYFTTKHSGRGVGLGLSTVHDIVRDSRGDIGVVSRPGRGTRFHVYLPVCEG